MNTLFRPTLVRRVVLALLISSPLVWVALTTKNLLQLWQQQEYDRWHFASSSVGLQLRDALATVENPNEARIVGAAIDRINNGSRQRNNASSLSVLQIWDRREPHLVFSAAAVADTILHGDPDMRTRASRLRTSFRRPRRAISRSRSTRLTISKRGWKCRPFYRSCRTCSTTPSAMGAKTAGSSSS